MIGASSVLWFERLSCRCVGWTVVGVDIHGASLQSLSCDLITVLGTTMDFDAASYETLWQMCISST